MFLKFHTKPKEQEVQVTTQNAFFNVERFDLPVDNSDKLHNLMDIFCASLLLMSTDSGHVNFSAANSSFPTIIIFVTNGLYIIFGYRAVFIPFHVHNCNESFDGVVET